MLCCNSQDPVASMLLSGALLLRIYCCFGLPPIKVWPLSQIGESFANQGLPYFQVGGAFD